MKGEGGGDKNRVKVLGGMERGGRKKMEGGDRRD
jgi:hypothetical protein